MQSAGNGRIAWYERGPLDAAAADEPVLMIMGLGASARLWYRLVPWIARRHRTILFDNRGTGDSAAVRSRLTMGGLAVLLALASILLVANTIRLSMYARRREVEVMKLVGATDWFIRWPFVIEGVVVGALGGITAILLLGVVKVTLVDPLASDFALIAAPDTMNFGLLVAVLLGSAVGVSALGSGLSLRRFLRV